MVGESFIKVVADAAQRAPAPQAEAIRDDRHQLAL